MKLMDEPMTDAHVLVVGESLTDIVVHPGEAPVEHPGGSPMNVAVGLSRLGIATGFHTSIGGDDRGAEILRQLAESSVAVTPESTNRESTSTARATIGSSGAAEYDFAVHWQPAPGVRAGEGTLAVHAGSVSAVIEPGASEVREIIEAARSRCTISYDPNVRPQLMGTRESARRRIEAIVSLADVVKSSDEDLQWLFPDQDPLDAAARWARGGPALVVVTRGGAGAWATTGAVTVTVDAPRVELVDTIGAGDSFMAGLLAALADRSLLGTDRRDVLAALGADELAGIVRFAIGCAAITVTRAGADPPTRADLAGVR